MKNKVLLYLCDGTRPQEAEKSFDKYIDKNMFHTNFCCRAVYPSTTLPCHLSLIYSIDPSVHGTLDKFYKPFTGHDNLFDHIYKSGLTCSFYYSWGELKDLYFPNDLLSQGFYSCDNYGPEKAVNRLTEEALTIIRERQPDFVFLYNEYPDETGHTSGWGSKEYSQSVDFSFSNLKYIMDNLPDNYRVLVTADHGGHGFSHGSDSPEDMTIPILIDSRLETNDSFSLNPSIKDIAPTICDVLDIEIPKTFSGHSLVKK